MWLLMCIYIDMLGIIRRSRELPLKEEGVAARVVLRDMLPENGNESTVICGASIGAVWMKRRIGCEDYYILLVRALVWRHWECMCILLYYVYLFVGKVMGIKICKSEFLYANYVAHPLPPTFGLFGEAYKV